MKLANTSARRVAKVSFSFLFLHCTSKSSDFGSDSDREDYSDVREVFLDKMLRYVASVDTIDSIFQEGKVPSLAEYWQRRDLTAGVYPVLATLPYVTREFILAHGPKLSAR